MSSSDPSDSDPKETSGSILGLTKKRRYKIYAWGALLLVLSAVVLTWFYLRPDKWYTYTDDVAFKQVARDVKPGYVVWDPAQAVTEVIGAEGMIGQPAISSDGARMVYAVKSGADNSNIFLRIWDGINWQEPRPMRALNSQFNETTPTLSGNGELLFFTSDRPGGQGGQDIWVSKWDGVEYAWP